MKHYIVMYEKDDTTTGYWSCDAYTLAVCVIRFNEQIGGWMERVIDWREEEIKDELDAYAFSRKLFIVILAILISSCGTAPFFIGKKHQLVPGNSQHMAIRKYHKEQRRIADSIRNATLTIK